ncbi:MAG TPA: imidazoleglycerol-phosphate dehydratase HisB [bacterium]
MPKTTITRKTHETDVTLKLDLFGNGKSNIDTGIGFFDHMLTLLAFHSGFDLDVKCSGDLQVDGHHTVEDVGIVLGQAFKQHLPADRAIVRYGLAYLPMDESLARAVVDISGRPALVFLAKFSQPKVGDFETELVQEFFQAFVNHSFINLHLQLLYGENAHHQIESLFKATARALQQALQPSVGRKGAASSKGVLV